MKFVVIGLGSMGQRRVRLLQQYFASENRTDWSVCGVDMNAKRCASAKEKWGLQTFSSIQEAVEAFQPDAAVVSTSPMAHAAIISECLQHDLHVFTEINLVADGYVENMKLAEEKGKVLFLSSTPMYRKEMQFITEKVKACKLPGCYHYHIGQYLPEWHPWESYKNFFVSKKRTNACRELFAIELPWLIDAFGEIVSCQAVHNKSTALELDYDDTYQVILRHASGFVGNLNIDVSTPKAGREFEAWSEHFYVEWKGVPESLQLWDAGEKKLQPISLYEDVEHQEGYNSFVIENEYYDELAEYIAVIEGRQQPRYSFAKDLKTLKLIDTIES